MEVVDKKKASRPEYFECDECGNNLGNGFMVNFDDEIWLCADCLKKALELLNEKHTPHKSS